ncbi:hypothetical protein QC334_31330 [Streptomyces sp. DH18]|uniref:hypothetical protein n=1 Tax=Streptomyces sp. DH18 TaxID=3040126 RepID=UPI002441C273|nr:hypothetical protein [Streptomyces sp. DH18]MDG9687172.1 hypothetical protein [Streptomyces sp. DH18]
MRGCRSRREDTWDEEDLPLPRLQDCVNTAQPQRPRTVWEAVRKSTATSPYPVVPRRPLGNALLGVPLSIDRMRDALGRRGWPS